MRREIFWMKIQVIVKKYIKGDGTDLKEFLAQNMKESTDYHYSINVSSGKIYKDNSKEHTYRYTVV